MKSERVFELDALRGLALLVMILYHAFYDLRYVYMLPILAFQDELWYHQIIQPVFLCVFLAVSGISCTLSRNNARRGFRLLLLALAMSVLSILTDQWLNFGSVIYFNVLHVLAIGILLFAWMTRRERRVGLSSAESLPAGTTVVILLLALTVWLVDRILIQYKPQGSWALLPLGYPPPQVGDVADYLPLIPWLAVFLLGTAIGRIGYVSRRSFFPGAPSWLLRLLRPLMFLGRHSLLVYALHQPLTLGLLSGLRAAGWI